MRPAGSFNTLKAKALGGVPIGVPIPPRLAPIGMAMVSATRPLPEGGNDLNTGVRKVSQQHVLRTLAEWRNQGLRHHHVESALGSGYGEYETAQEEDDGRVGEARHHTLIVEQLAHLCLRALHDLKGGVADEEQQHEDDHYAGCPCRYGLGEPEHHGHDEDGDDALLHDGEPVDAEAVDGQVPDDNGKQSRYEKQQCFLAIKIAIQYFLYSFLHYLSVLRIIFLQKYVFFFYLASFFAEIVKKMPKNVVVSRKNAIFAEDLPITAIGDAENLEHPEG
ncbi:Uncharacterised protein [Segatella copri]|nr:Uncharacterised protein [Segatella copri]